MMGFLVMFMDSVFVTCSLSSDKKYITFSLQEADL